MKFNCFSITILFSFIGTFIFVENLGKFEPLIDISEKELADLKDLSSTIKEKVKFLSEGKEPVSPVQEMAIQLEVC